MKIVYVYLGEHMPRYAIENIKMFSDRFSKYETWFLSNNLGSLEKFRGTNVKTWQCKNPMLTVEELIEFSNVDRNFRGGFWLLAIARFYAIEEFVKSTASESILQIESDVLVFDSFPFENFHKVEKQIAFPLVNDEFAIPSIVYFREYESILNLIQFMRGQLQSGENVTDMSILREYSKSYSNRVEILPTNFPDKYGYQKWVTRSLIKELSQNIESYNGLFDAATWGQYLGGEDPRNTLGIRRVFHVLRHHAVNPQRFKWSYDGKYLYVAINNNKLPLFCLHIHSKDSKFFVSNYFNRVQERVNLLPSNEIREFLLVTAIRNFSFITFRSLLAAYSQKFKKDRELS